MFTDTKRRGSAMVIGILVLAASFAGTRAADADSATFTDPNDTASKLDVSGGSVSNTPSVITYEVTMDPFTAADVNRVTFLFDFNEDGVADNCLLVAQSSGPTGLEGTMYSGCTESDLIGTATASIVSGNTLKVDLPLGTLRMGGLGNGSAYAFKVETRDVIDPSSLTPDDVAPDTGFVIHQLGQLVCGGTVRGKVKLTQDITGCTGDGLIVGKRGTKINLNGFKVESAYVDSSSTTGAGINVNGLKTVGISNGKIAGFSTGIRIENSNNPKDKRKHTKVVGVTVEGNTTGVNLVGGKYIDVTNSVIQNNRGVGVTFNGSKIKVAANQVTGNGLDGIQQTAGAGAAVSGNTASNNGTAPGALNGDGIDLDGTGGVNKNTANNNDGDGINAPSAKGKANTATGNAGTQCDPVALCP